MGLVLQSLEKALELLKMEEDFGEHGNHNWVLPKCVEADNFVEALESSIHEEEHSVLLQASKITPIIKAKKMKNAGAGSGSAIPLVPINHNHHQLQQNHIVDPIVMPSAPPPAPLPLNLPRSDLLEGNFTQTVKQRKNKAGETPQDVFTKNHADLVTKGESWMKNTASQCIVVSALIATITFAVAFTLTDGHNQGTSIPFFRKEPSFIIFVISDAVSLICSSTSILIFLSILTSHYAEQDFLDSLPRKLVNGIATLFLSIVTMMIPFSVSFCVLYIEKMVWVLITGLACIPANLNVTQQLSFQGCFSVGISN